jgi:hypothetical protein
MADACAQCGRGGEVWRSDGLVLHRACLPKFVAKRFANYFARAERRTTLGAEEHAEIAAQIAEFLISAERTVLPDVVRSSVPTVRATVHAPEEKHTCAHCKKADGEPMRTWYFKPGEKWDWFHDACIGPYSNARAADEGRAQQAKAAEESRKRAEEQREALKRARESVG